MLPAVKKHPTQSKLPFRQRNSSGHPLFYSLADASWAGHKNIFICVSNTILKNEQWLISAVPWGFLYKNVNFEKWKIWSKASAHLLSLTIHSVKYHCLFPSSGFKLCMSGMIDTFFLQPPGSCTVQPSTVKSVERVQLKLEGKELFALSVSFSWTWLWCVSFCQFKGTGVNSGSLIK